MLDVYGSVSYFAGGAELAAGRYQVRYLDGCMRYGKNGGWTVHASELGTATAYLATETVEEWAVLPGTFGDRVGKGAFEEFAECVTANQRLDPVPFDFEGGVLGVGLVDSNYADNMPGVDGVSPSWELQQLGTCGDQ